MEALNRQGFYPALFPIYGNHAVDVADSRYFSSIRAAISKQEGFSYDSFSLRLWHANDLSLHCGNVRCGFPIFELNKFTDTEHHHISTQDYLFVTSQWAKSVVLAETTLSDSQVFIVPLGVDFSIFNNRVAKHPTLAVREDETVFINVGKLEVRKGHITLVDAFSKAFTKNDNVRLILCNHNFFYTKEEMNLWNEWVASSNLASKIIHVGRAHSQEVLAQVMQNADCGVFPSKAEGWNLEALELLAMGKSLIITNYSAHTEFCTSDCSKLIQINDLEPAYDKSFFLPHGKWFFGQGEWAKFGKEQDEQLIEYMRAVHKSKQNGDNIFNKEGVKIATEFSWDNTARKILASLAEIGVN